MKAIKGDRITVLATAVTLARTMTLATMLTLLATPAQAGNKVYAPNIQSLTTVVGDDWLNRPVLTLNTNGELSLKSNQVMTVRFDELSHTYQRMTYHLEHCEADWTPSTELFESDWLQGFNDLQIDDYENSINTSVQYTHYQFQIPNERCQLKMSGNYRITIYSDKGEKLMEVEFYVVEPLVQISMDATSNTDIDYNQSHQQLSMNVTYGNLRITNTDEELYTVVMKNWQEAGARTHVKPNYITPRQLVWQHNRQLIFDAGNEYHKYEILDTDHTTMGLDRIAWDGEHYQAYPTPATVRRNYLTDVDADGAFCIRNSDRTESDITCDYVMVNYTLEAPDNGPVYIDGHWTIHQPRDTYQMHYDPTAKCYRATILQKQGYYSYQLLTEDYRTAPSEGNFYQTENRYQALIYYRSSTDRSWRLVGYQCAQF